MPAKLVYVSSGPYKRYEYGPYDIELRHRANRDLLERTDETAAALKAAIRKWRCWSYYKLKYAEVG